MAQKLTLGHSPDPDDAFMFYGVAKGLIPTGGFQFDHILQDIQTLNQRATRGELDITAISIHAYAYVSGQYALLSSGASMGDGYGPMLVAKKALNRAELTRARNRWTRYDLIVIDELGYVVMPDTAAELLFQVVAGRSERAAVIVTTNLPFSEWTTKFPNARLCKAMLDRLTDQAHIIDTGKDSYRFLRTLKKLGKGARA